MSSLTELSTQEQEVFVILLKMIMRADGRLSDEELDHLDAFMNEVGEEAWRAMLDASRTAHVHVDELRQVAARVERPQAQAILHARLSGVATANGMSPEEAAILNALAGIWALDLVPSPRRHRRSSLLRGGPVYKA